MKEILQILNPWWKTGEVKKELAKEYKRDCFSEIMKFLDQRQIIGLYGLRRTGKSTLFFQVMEHILKKGLSKEKIIYFSFDEKVSDIKDIFSAYKEIHDLDLDKGKYYVFLDEIQKLEDWANKIKIFYDMYPNIKFFVSGSAQLLIKKQARESLGGRIKLLKVDPLSFSEWLQLNNLNYKPTKLYEEELRSKFKLFTKTPFPEIATTKEELIIKSYVSEMIVSKVLSYDIPKIFKEADLELLETLKNIFFSEPGYILNFDSLAKDLGRSKKTLRDHVFYMEQAMLIRILHNYRGSMLSSSRKQRRVYPYHSALTIGTEESLQMENLFVSILDAEYYWREGRKEVDIVKNKKPVEIKYKEKIRDTDLNNVLDFMKKFKQKEAILISRTDSSTKRGIKITPAWRAALELKD